MSYVGNIPENLKYTKEHEWINTDDGTVGITDYAQHALTDVVFVELPQLGKQALQFKQLCVIESVKSVSDVFSPMSGEVSEINESLLNNPEFVNQEPYGKGWVAKLKITKAEEANSLMSAEQYKKHLEGLH